VIATFIRAQQRLHARMGAFVRRLIGTLCGMVEPLTLLAACLHGINDRRLGRCFVP
jgi:hypothetical protein